VGEGFAREGDVDGEASVVVGVGCELGVLVVLPSESVTT
jgi:hypothetical protein